MNEFAVVIIQSLKGNENQTGTKLFSEILKYKKIQEDNLTIKLIDVRSKYEFLDELQKLAKRVKSEKVFPILHLEMHGSEYGVKLSSDEFVRWEEIISYFRKINVLLGNYLMILMSMCKGISVLSCFDPDERAPFRVLIGASKDISENDLLKSFDAFYDNYFFSFDFQKGVAAMNNEIESKTFFSIKSEDFFDIFFDTRLNTKQNEAIRSLVPSVKSYRKELINKTDDEIFTILSKEIESKLAKSRMNRDKYIMKDLQSKES